MSQVLSIPRFCMCRESYFARVSQGMLKGFLIDLGIRIARAVTLFWKQLKIQISE